jgi:hypothetical protein
MHLQTSHSHMDTCHTCHPEFRPIHHSCMCSVSKASQQVVLPMVPPACL